jgi:hypothetical protein
MVKFYILCCLIPSILAGALIAMGVHCWNSIPVGDLGFRYLASLPSFVVAGVIIVSVLILLILNRRQIIIVTPARLTFQDAGSLRSVNWGLVNLSGIVSGFMLKYAIVSMGGKESRRIDSFFYPEFETLYRTLDEMISADRARGV